MYTYGQTSDLGLRSGLFCVFLHRFQQRGNKLYSSGGTRQKDVSNKAHLDLLFSPPSFLRCIIVIANGRGNKKLKMIKDTCVVLPAMILLDTLSIFRALTDDL